MCLKEKGAYEVGGWADKSRDWVIVVSVLFLGVGGGYTFFFAVLSFGKVVQGWNFLWVIPDRCL